MFAPTCAAPQAVINFKWNTWAQRFLAVELAAYCVWLAAFTTFSLLFQNEDDRLGLLQLAATPAGAASLGCSVLALVVMAPFVYMVRSVAGGRRRRSNVSAICKNICLCSL